MNYIINEQKDGDGYYNIHTTTCPYRPNANYKYCNGTKSDAASKIGVSVSQIKFCSHCVK